MTRYAMENGSVIDTDRATDNWEEDTNWDGSNHISVATGSQWEHETLYRSRKGRFYVERTSQWQGSLPSARWISSTEAVAWLLANNRDVPEDLAQLVEDIVE